MVKIILLIFFFKYVEVEGKNLIQNFCFSWSYVLYHFAGAQ